MKNFSRYIINKDGTIFSKKTKANMKPWVINSGYAVIALWDDDLTKHKFLVHRLIAMEYLDNPNNLETVNHKNGNRLDNRIENLEWSSMSEQHKHAFSVLGKIHPCPTKGTKQGKYSKYHNVSYDIRRNKWVGSIRLNGKSILQKRFDSEQEAAIHVNLILDTLGITDRPRNIIENA
jgi:hypothetical protein